LILVFLETSTYNSKQNNKMAFEHTSPLYVASLPRELTQELEKFQYLPIPEFTEHTMLVLPGKSLRDIFSAHLNARNQVCGALMGMLVWPESKREQSKWYRLLGILQREDQYLRTIAEYYNRVHAVSKE
jgi:hypothetical protein